MSDLHRIVPLRTPLADINPPVKELRVSEPAMDALLAAERKGLKGRAEDKFVLAAACGVDEGTIARLKVYDFTKVMNAYQALCGELDVPNSPLSDE